MEFVSELQKSGPAVLLFLTWSEWNFRKRAGQSSRPGVQGHWLCGRIVHIGDIQLEIPIHLATGNDVQAWTSTI